MTKATNTLRLHLSSGFTQIPNSTVRDKNLSFRATGLLTYMVSMADGWVFSVNRLANAKSDGKDSAAAAARELEVYGYLLRQRVRDGNGRLGGVVWHIADHPAFLNQSADLPQQANPDTGNPDADFPCPANPPLRKLCKQNHHLEKNEEESDAADFELMTNLLRAASDVGEIGLKTTDALTTLVANCWVAHGGDRKKDVEHIRNFILSLPCVDEDGYEKWDEALAWEIRRCCKFPSQLSKLKLTQISC